MTENEDANNVLVIIEEKMVIVGWEYRSDREERAVRLVNDGARPVGSLKTTASMVTSSHGGRMSSIYQPFWLEIKKNILRQF